MKILDFGSINIDEVFQVDHFVRPGETMSTLGYAKNCGGKGLNQSIALARAGAEVYHACMVGEGADFLVETMRESGVDVSLMKKIDAPAGRAIIQVNESGQNCILLFGGSNHQNTEEYIHWVIDQFEAGDILLLQNELNLTDTIINCAAEKGMRIVLNPSPMNEALTKAPLEKVEYFILNEVEGEEIAGGQKDPEAICDALLKKYPGCKVVLTLGKHGVMYKDAETKATHGIYDVKRVDSTAAGDTFTGYFLACLAEGLSIDVILEKASKASSIAVGRPGAAPSIPTRQEVDTTDIEPLNL